MGEVVRAYVLGRKAEVSVSLALAVTFLERLLDERQAFRRLRRLGRDDLQALGLHLLHDLFDAPDLDDDRVTLLRPGQDLHLVEAHEAELHLAQLDAPADDGVEVGAKDRATREDQRAVVLADVEDHLARVVLHRRPVNALNKPFVRELTAAARALARRKDVRVISVTSSLGIFCAGADLKERAGLPPSRVGQTVRAIQQMVFAWASLPQPVVAGVAGAALGGGLEFALAADLIAASEEAVFGFPEVTLGIIPAGGGTQLLTDRVSRATASRWVLTGRRFSAHEAARAPVDHVRVLRGRKQHLDEMKPDRPPYSTRYPELAQLEKYYADDKGVPPEGNRILRNVVVGKWLELRWRVDPKIVEVRDNLTDQDPLFVDASRMNFQLRDDSPAYKLGFKRIPFEKIGLDRK